MPQIVSNFRAGGTGQLSLITYGLNTAGAAARIFTSIQEQAGPAMLRGAVISERGGWMGLKLITRAHSNHACCMHMHEPACSALPLHRHPAQRGACRPNRVLRRQREEEGRPAGQEEGGVSSAGWRAVPRLSSYSAAQLLLLLSVLWPPRLCLVEGESERRVSSHASSA